MNLREKSYQVAMHFLRQMLGKELITQKEYEDINEMMIEKYRPLIGTLTSKKFPKWDQNEGEGG